MQLSGNYQGHSLVFLVGCPRSGTTWLQRLLACHPAVRTGQESDVFDLFVGPQLRTWRTFLNPEMSGRTVGLAAYFREDEYIPILRRYMLDLLQPMVGNLAPGELFLEKTPSHALFIPEIAELLPESRFIHVLRDPRDVVSSLLAASKGWGKQWAPRDASSAVRMWVEHVCAARNSARYLPGDRFHELRYEEMSADPEIKLKEIAEFLGLSWKEAGIRAAIEMNLFETAKRTDGGTAIELGGELRLKHGGATREPEGFFRKGRVGAWREDLTGEDLTQIEQIAATLMLELGYCHDYHFGYRSPEHPQKNKCTPLDAQRFLEEGLASQSTRDYLGDLIEKAKACMEHGDYASALKYLKDIDCIVPDLKSLAPLRDRCLLMLRRQRRQ